MQYTLLQSNMMHEIYCECYTVMHLSCNKFFAFVCKEKKKKLTSLFRDQNDTCIC